VSASSAAESATESVPVSSMAKNPCVLPAVIAYESVSAVLWSLAVSCPIASPSIAVSENGRLASSSTGA